MFAGASSGRSPDSCSNCWNATIGRDWGCSSWRRHRRGRGHSAARFAPGSVYPLVVVTIRPATVQDAPALGRLHVRAWQAAYRGQMPEDYLDGLRPEERAAGWERSLRRDRDRDPVLVAQQEDRVVGFAVMGAAEDPQGAGELYAINVDPDHWGTGAGRALLATAEAELARLGYVQAVLWVLPGNARARRFYEVAGWTTDGAQRTTEVLGVVVPEVRYQRRLRGLPGKP
jgi:GNAT superfamily N-acetyltransferase